MGITSLACWKGQLATEPFSDSSVGKGTAVTSWSRSQLSPLPAAKTLSVFQTLMLKPRRYRRVGLGLGLAASRTSLLPPRRAVREEDAEPSSKPKRFTPGNVSCQPHRLLTACSWGIIVGFPEDAALTFVAVDRVGSWMWERARGSLLPEGSALVLNTFSLSCILQNQLERTAVNTFL